MARPTEEGRNKARVCPGALLSNEKRVTGTRVTHQSLFSKSPRVSQPDSSTHQGRLTVASNSTKPISQGKTNLFPALRCTLPRALFADIVREYTRINKYIRRETNLLLYMSCCLPLSSVRPLLLFISWSPRQNNNQQSLGSTSRQRHTHTNSRPPSLFATAAHYKTMPNRPHLVRAKQWDTGQPGYI